MLSLSAKTVNLSAWPSPSVSSQIAIRSRPCAVRLLGVGVVDGLGDPEPAAVVPGHADRLADLGLGGEELRLEPGRHDHVLHRFLGRERLLHLADRLALRAPLAARQVVGNVDRRLVVGERLQALPPRAGGCRRRRPCRQPSGCRARPGRGSRASARSARRGRRRCRRRAPCRACEPTSTAPPFVPRPGLAGRGGPSSLCLVWT